MNALLASTTILSGNFGDVLLNLLVLVLVFALVFWVMGQFALPEPLGKVVRVILVVIATLLVIGLIAGHGLIIFQ